MRRDQKELIDHMISSEKELRTSRSYELDLLRAAATVSMILCHCAIRLGEHLPGYEQDIRYLIGDIVLGDYLAVAHAFMFAMGVGVVYSRRNSPAELIRRGVRLYILGFVLNFLRYGIYALADGLLSGEFMEETVYALVVQDIFHFAGLALIVTGLFRQLKLKAAHIFLIGLALSALGGPLAFVFQGSAAADYFLGHFLVTTEDDSCFAFLNWYVFVASGILFGTLLRRTEDPDRFYRTLLRAACPVMLLYLVLTAVHFLLKKTDAQRLTVFFEMSRNVTLIYCIHWCILGSVESVFCYLLGVVFPWPVIYLFGAVLTILSVWLAKRWADRRQEKTSGKKRGGCL